MIDLKRVEKYRENNRIEAKKALGGLPHSIWETYSAFANTLGGVILLGVEEYRDKTFHVVDLPDPEGMIAEFKEKLNDGRKVNVNILTERDISIETFEGKRFIAINIPRAHRFDKPIYIDGTPLGGTYRRGGEGDYKCTREEIEGMRRDAERLSADMTVFEDLDISALHSGTVEKFQNRSRERRGSTADGNDLLGRLGAISDGHPTAAGLLMLGKRDFIKKKYPFFGAVYAEKRSEDEPVLSLEGENLFEFYLEAEKRISRSVCMLGMCRKDEIAVNEAVCEALANSIIHADYLSSCPISVEMTPYELTVTNPGLLRIDPSVILDGGTSDRRNSLIAKMLYLIGIGSGGVRGIYEVWRNRNWCPPSLTEDFSPERVTLRLTFGRSLHNDKSEVGVTESRRAAVINYITAQIEVTSSDISSLLGISRENTRLLLKNLADDNILTFEKRGNTYYYMMKA